MGKKIAEEVTERKGKAWHCNYLTFTSESVSNAAKNLKAAWNTLTRSKSEKGRKDICISVRGIAFRNTGTNTERVHDMEEQRTEETAKVEMVGIEGSGWYWWFVCEGCRSIVKAGQEVCLCCERRLIWND